MGQSELQGWRRARVRSDETLKRLFQVSDFPRGGNEERVIASVSARCRRKPTASNAAIHISTRVFKETTSTSAAGPHRGVAKRASRPQESSKSRHDGRGEPRRTRCRRAPALPRRWMTLEYRAARRHRTRGCARPPSPPRPVAVRPRLRGIRGCRGSPLRSRWIMRMILRYRAAARHRRRGRVSTRPPTPSSRRGQCAAV